jgi:UDP-2,3-diacylglucosamine hydrolase
MDVMITEKSRYVNLGEWVKTYSYAEFDGQELHLKYFEKPVVASV